MKVVIIGASGHGKVAFDALIENNRYSIMGFIDDNKEKQNDTICGLEVLGNTDFLLYELRDEIEGVFIAIGNNEIRKSLYDKIKHNFKAINAIHPKSVISKTVNLEKCILVVAGSIINSHSQIQNGAIINTGATVDHDNYIGEFSHIAPGVHLAGSVKIGAFTFVGIGTSVIQNVEIGSNSIIGAGSVVIKNIPDNCLAYGVPAKIIKYF